MEMVSAGRAAYRVRQFVGAVMAYISPLSSADWGEIGGVLPEAARLLFARMPANDRRHGLRVMRALRSAGEAQPALMQAALLHDVAKHGNGITLVHRVLVVLLKALRPRTWEQIAALPAPRRSDLRYPLWAHANHAAAGAAAAEAAGCATEAVALIRHHQEARAGAIQDPAFRRLLLALQAADDDN